MKKIDISWIIAVLWIIVACVFFSMNKIGVGMAWLLVGIYNLNRAIRITKQKNNIKIAVEPEKEPYNQQKATLEAIELSDEVHTIYDESIGYGYVVNKAFKPAKSHAAEVELLCTYAPNSEYGSEGNCPYIAVQVDDDVYCAVEEYKENQTFEDAISIEPLDGQFMFRAKRKYYEYMMYFYGFELEDHELWDKAGLCLVYPKVYVGTEDEEKMMHILDEAAKSFKKN